MQWLGAGRESLTCFTDGGSSGLRLGTLVSQMEGCSCSEPWEHQMQNDYITLNCI